MKRNLGLMFCGLALLSVVSCFDPSQPNYQYFPDMYESVGYDTYAEAPFLNGTAAQLPVEGSIPRGWQPYDYPNTNEGYELAKAELTSPLEKTDEHRAEGKELYAIYCAVCHGSKGDGQGILVKREKFLGVPKYNDPARAITIGSIYHTIYYGKNAMGSHAAQLNDTERWQVAHYVEELKSKLK